MERGLVWGGAQEEAARQQRAQPCVFNQLGEGGLARAGWGNGFIGRNQELLTYCVWGV